MYKHIVYATFMCILFLIFVDAFNKKRNYINYSAVVFMYFFILLFLHITEVYFQTQILSVKIIYFSMVPFLVLFFIVVQYYKGPVPYSNNLWELTYIVLVLVFTRLFFNKIQGSHDLSMLFLLTTTIIYSLLRWTI